MKEKYIIFVDDDEIVRSLGSRVLSKLGYPVETYEEGNPFDYRLSQDTDMPGMSGIEVLEKNQKKLEGIPKVLISGNEDSSLPERAANCGAIFFKKPANFEKIGEYLVNNMKKE